MVDQLEQLVIVIQAHFLAIYVGLPLNIVESRSKDKNLFLDHKKPNDNKHGFTKTF